ncbi:MAG: hypothetical protein COA99_18805 [Moraxellaceae bacterium]|nr:MAG: hypothetical protein COA99_18805 [Moraxellaceae bacterium]
MLINSAVQLYAAIDPLAGEVKPEGSNPVRSDIPPVKEAVNAEHAKSRAFTLPDAKAEASETSASLTENTTSRRPLAGPIAPQAGALSAPPASLAAAQTQEEKLIISQLKARDREVRVHEAAHAAVGGQYAGSPSLQYVRGPDGVNYAAGGEVSINVGAISGDPQATIAKARVVRAAALAPASPSAQDRRVASLASRIESNARVELQAIRAEQRETVKTDTNEAETPEAEAAKNALAEEELREAKLRELREQIAADDSTGIDTEGVGVGSIAPAVSAGTQEGDDNSDDSSADEDSSDDNGGIFQADRTTAKDRLEEILLAARPIPIALNELGLIDAENPDGKSGFFSVFA